MCRQYKPIHSASLVKLSGSCISQNGQPYSVNWGKHCPKPSTSTRCGDIVWHIKSMIFVTIIQALLTSSKSPHKTWCSEIQMMSPLFDLFLICRSFVIQQIPSSNLFMVVVDNECFCDSVPPITMAPIEIRYILLLAKLSEGDSRSKCWKISYYVKLATWLKNALLPIISAGYVWN